MKCKLEPKRFGVHIKCHDIEKSLRFYELLGFNVIFVYGTGKFREMFPGVHSAEEKYCGIVFEIGDALFEIADGHIAVKDEVFEESIHSSKVSAMVDIDSVDAVVDICRSQDIRIAVQPKVYPWGTKEVVIKDPDGFVLVFREKVNK